MTGREYCYQHYEHQHYCFSCSHIDGLHPRGSCTSMVKTRKEWYILGNVKLAEAIVSEPCKCSKYISKLDFAKSNMC
jgi:hypothetical protein